mmetsp:Transcript_31816/g.97894  ORF Transcript_31816/g.97894 Transcript_31816/m.97894 type:complete len:173 (-) Transcript_31816:42-560(-)
MPPGGNALAVLGASIIVGIGIAHATPKVDASKFADEAECKARNRVRVYSCATGFVALVFWAWAVRNCFIMGFDLGVASFACAIAAVARCWYCASLPDPEPMKRARRYLCGGCVFVSLNYVLALFIIRVGTLLWAYMLVGAVVWAANAAFGVSALDKAAGLGGAGAPLLGQGG